MAIGYDNVGAVWGKLGDHHKQLEFYQKCLAIWEKVLPFGHPKLVITLRRIAQSYGKLGDSAKQVEYNDRADKEQHAP